MSIEWSMYQAKAAPANAAFVPAEASVSVAQLTRVDGRQDNRFALGHYRERKFATMDEGRGRLDPMQQRAIEPLLTDWRKLPG